MSAVPWSDFQSTFWNDLADNLKDPEFRKAYVMVYERPLLASLLREAASNAAFKSGLDADALLSAADLLDGDR
jgi:hypothetical protein